MDVRRIGAACFAGALAVGAPGGGAAQPATQIRLPGPCGAGWMTNTTLSACTRQTRRGLHVRCWWPQYTNTKRQAWIVYAPYSGLNTISCPLSAPTTRYEAARPPA